MKRKIIPALLTLLIFALIFRKIPFYKLAAAFAGADIVRFLAWMIPNSLLYFAWDTFLLALVIRWFHGPIRYDELLPVRAVSYVLALLQTQVAQFTMAFYLQRKLNAPFLRLAGTVLFLTLTEITHLALWALAGMVLFHALIPSELFWIPAGFAIFWTLFLVILRIKIPVLQTNPPDWMQFSFGWLMRFREWEIFQTLVRAPMFRYFQWIALRAPLFAISLAFHYFAVRSFGMTIPFWQLMAFLPIVFVIGAIPITVGRLGTTQLAWIFFFSPYAAQEKLLAYSLASHLTFLLCRGILGIVFLPRAWRELAEMRTTEFSVRT